MHVLILAAGYGLRLRPLTLFYPKPLVPILNQPLLAYPLAHLGRLGLQRVFVNRHYLAEAFPEPAYWKEQTGVEVHYLDERDMPYGTGGAIRNLVNREGLDDVLVINGDTLFLQDLRPFLTAAADCPGDALLMVRSAPERGYTVLHYDPRRRRLTRHPGSESQRVMFAGVAWLSQRLVQRLPETYPSDWFQDAWSPAEAEGARLYGFLTRAPWWDLGDADHFWRTCGQIVRSWAGEPDRWEIHRPLLADAGHWLRPGVWSHPSADVAATTEFHDWAMIGAGVQITGASRLGRVIVARSAHIRRARIEQSFVGTGVVVEGWEVENAVVALRDGQLQLVSW